MANKEEDTLIEDNTVSFFVYFKGFFLIILVIIGMIFVNRLSNKPKKTEEPTVQSATHTSLISLKQATTTYIEERVKKDGIMKSLQNTSGQVMGEATKAADIVVDKTTESVKDVFYEHTLEAAIVTLIEKIPERQKDLFFERLCESYQCESSTSADITGN